MRGTRLPAGVTVPYDVWVRKEPTTHWTVQARSQTEAKKIIRNLGHALTEYELDAVRRELK